MACISTVYFPEREYLKSDSGVINNHKSEEVSVLKSKKCPNCGANLCYTYGDKDVHCSYCRGDFVVEYKNSEALREENYGEEKIKELQREYEAVWGK